MVDSFRETDMQGLGKTGLYHEPGDWVAMWVVGARIREGYLWSLGVEGRGPVEGSRGRGAVVVYLS